MKKIFVLSIALATLTFTSCGGEKEVDNKSTGEGDKAQSGQNASPTSGNQSVSKSNDEICDCLRSMPRSKEMSQNKRDSLTQNCDPSKSLEEIRNIMYGHCRMK